MINNFNGKIYLSLIKRNEFFIIFLYGLLPIALVTGPFLPDLFISLISLYFLIILFKDKSFLVQFCQNNKEIFIFIIFYLLILARSFLADDILLSLEGSLFYFRFIIFSISTCYFLTKYEYLFKIIFFSILITLISLLIDGSVQFLTGINLLGFELIYQYRVSSFFYTELILGSFSSKLLLIFLIIFFEVFKKNKNKNYFVLIIFFSFSYLILISGERTALIMTILFIISFFTFINFKDKYKLILLFFITSLILTIIVFQNKPYQDRYNQTITEIKNTESIFYFSKHHQSHIQTAINMFKNKPFFGHGSNMFREVCKQKKYYIDQLPINISQNKGCSTHPHNIYFQLLAENGIIGFLVFFSFYVVVGIRFLINFFHKNNSENKNNFIIYSLSNLAILIILWPLITSNSFFNQMNNIFLYFLIGINFYYKIKSQNIKC